MEELPITPKISSAISKITPETFERAKALKRNIKQLTRDEEVNADLGIDMVEQVRERKQQLASIAENEKKKPTKESPLELNHLTRLSEEQQERKLREIFNRAKNIISIKFDDGCLTDEEYEMAVSEEADNLLDIFCKTGN